MYWKPQQPNNNPSNPFFHPLNQKLNEVKATARNIVKGLGDADGPFTVVAMKRDKVIKQETTKRRDMLPAIISTMRKEVGSGVTIAVEDKRGTIRSTFKESVNEERQFKARVAFMGQPKDNARDMRAAGRMKMYDTATERNVPSKRKSTVFDITFKSERQFNQFMGAYDVEFLERLDEGMQLDEVTGETRVMAKGDRNHFERITRALGHASANGKIAGYEGAHINEPKGIITLIFNSKAHKPKSERQKVAKMLKTHGLKFDHSIEEGFASDAQRRAAFASGYKAKGKKKKKEEEVEEGLRQAMSGPKEAPEQKRKRQEKDNIDLYKKRQNRVSALRGDKSSRQLTPKQQRDYLRRVNLDQIKAMEETIMEGAKFSSAQLDRLKKEYAKISTVDPEKPTYKKLTDMLDKMTDEQLRQIEKAKIKFMSPLASNRLNNRKMKKEGVMEEKGTYSSMGRRGIDKPLMAYIADLEDELKKMGMKYSDKKVNPDDVMKAYNANMSPKDAAKMIKKKG